MGEVVSRGNGVPYIQSVTVPGSGSYAEVTPETPADQMIRDALIFNSLGEEILIKWEESGVAFPIPASGVKSYSEIRAEKFYLGSAGSGGAVKVEIIPANKRFLDPGYRESSFFNIDA